MAITTFTASEINSLKQIHAGPTTIRSRFVSPVSTSTLTVSSIIYMAKIPNGAILLDGYLAGGTQAGGEGTWNLGIRFGDGSTTFPVNPLTGLSVSDNSLIAAGTLSTGAVLRFTGGARLALPYQVSCSDGDANQFHWLVATAVLGSGTATVSLHLVAMYHSNANS